MNAMVMTFVMGMSVDLYLDLDCTATCLTGLHVVIVCCGLKRSCSCRVGMVCAVYLSSALQLSVRS